MSGEPESTAEASGEMAGAVRRFDWSRTSLGAMETWPAALSVAVDLCLGSRFPMFIWWGPELVNLYNDAYVPILRERHPGALGRPARELWGEIWAEIGPQVAEVMTRGTATWHRREKLAIERGGRREEAYFTWSHSPIRDERGNVRGVLGVVIEETPLVEAERERDRERERADHDRQTASEARRMSDVRFRRMVEQSPLSTQILAPDGRVRAVNRAFEELWGLSMADMAQYNLRTDPQLEALGVKEKIERAFGGEPVTLDPVPYRPTWGKYAGKVRWAGARIYPVKDDAGRVEEVVLVHEDVTERKEAVEALRESESRLRSLFEQSAAGIAQTDLAGRIQHVNERLCEFLGYGREELVGMRVLDLTHPDDRAETQAKVEQGAATGAEYAMEKRYVRKDGSVVWGALSAGVIKDAAGRPAALMGVVIDITSRKAAEAALDRQTRFLNAALDSISDFTYTFDREGRFQFANKPLLDLWGLTEEQVAGKRMSDLNYPPEMEAMFLRQVREVFDTRQTVSGEVEYTSPTGRFGHYEYTFSPVLTADGQVERVAGVARDITRRKQAEGALRELTERLARQSRLFEQIASTTPDFIYVFDLNWRFLYANRRLLEVWGRSAEEAFGKGLVELGYPDWHVEMHHRELEQVMRTKQPIKGVVPFTGGSGISGVYEYIFTPVLGPDGQVEVIAGTTRDVTERVNAERTANEARWAVEDSLARWQAVVANMTEGVVVADGAGNMLEWNAAALEMHGFHDLSEVRRNLSQLAPIFTIDELGGGNIPQERWPLRRLMRGEPFTNWEVRLRRLDRPMDRIISYSGTPIRDREGRISLVLMTLHDVTEERLAQRAARESEAALRDMFDKSPIGISINDLDGRYLHVNEAYCRLVGYTREELLDPSRDFRNLAHEEDRPRMLEMQRRLLTGEIASSFIEKRYIRKDGSLVWVRVTGTARRGPSGAMQFIRLVEDIDERKRAEAEREQLLSSERAARGEAERSAAEAERASRMKDEFLATLSHELRTPLNAILGWAQILNGNRGLPEEVVEAGEIIERNARVQTQIIEDLLDMSRIIVGKLRLDVRQIELPPVVRAAVETVRPAAEAKGVRLQTVLDAGAGPVRGDSGRLQQVFWNLINNAVKFTPRGGRVQVVLERVNSHLEVSVIDTGEGIAPEFLPHVFDRFRQADAGTTRRHGGLGLGLAIVKQLVELHGGSVRARSGGPGKGATFTVLLPLMPIEQLLPHPDDSRPSRAAAAPGSGNAVPMDANVQIDGLRVLVVDDEADARALVRRLLEDQGAIVKAAGSTAEALERLGEERFDVMVSDIGMPEEDGYTLIRRVRELPPDRGGQMPAIALTAYARPTDRMMALRAGFQQYAVKPVEPAELIMLVAALGGRI